VGCFGTACPCPCLCICLLRVKFCSGGDGPPQSTAGDRECMHTANLQAHACIYVLPHCFYVSILGPPVTLSISYSIIIRVAIGSALIGRCPIGWVLRNLADACIGCAVSRLATFLQHLCSFSRKTCFYMLGMACLVLFFCTLSEWAKGMS